MKPSPRTSPAPARTADAPAEVYPRRQPRVKARPLHSLISDNANAYSGLLATEAALPPDAADGMRRAGIRLRSARGRVLALMTTVRRPLTGGEVQTYALSQWPTSEIRPLMEGMERAGLVMSTAHPHPAAAGGVSWTYELASPPHTWTGDRGEPC